MQVTAKQTIILKKTQNFLSMKKLVLVTWMCLISLLGISQNFKTQIDNAKKIYIARFPVPAEIFFETGHDAYANPNLKKIGDWPKEIFSTFDDSLMARCNRLFGGGKVEWWPANYMLAKPDLMGRMEDEKKVECDFYILDTYKPSNVGIYEGNLNLIHYSKGMHSLQLCQKTQAGKKGKKVATGNNGLGQTGKNIYVGTPPRSTDLSAGNLDDAQKLAVQKMIEEFPIESGIVLNDFFKDIEKQMKK